MIMDEALAVEFRGKGCVKLPGFLDAGALAQCRSCFDEALQRPDHKLPKSTYADGTFYNPSTGYRGSDVLLRNLLERVPVITQAVADLWGSKNVWLYDHEIWNKAIGGGDEFDGRKRRGDHCITPFHQDTRVIAFAGEHLANVWIPFEDLPKENSLYCVKGSHKGPLYDFGGFNYDVRRAPRDPGRGKKEYPWVPEEFPPEMVLSWEMKQGDVIVLHPGTIHGGGPVTPTCPVRNTLVLRFFGDACFYNGELGAYSENSPSSMRTTLGGLEHGDHFSKAYPDMLLLGPGLPPEAKL